jgi:hypothetical protein
MVFLRTDDATTHPLEMVDICRGGAGNGMTHSYKWFHAKNFHNFFI